MVAFWIRIEGCGRGAPRARTQPALPGTPVPGERDADGVSLHSVSSRRVPGLQQSKTQKNLKKRTRRNQTDRSEDSNCAQSRVSALLSSSPVTLHPWLPRGAGAAVGQRESRERPAAEGQILGPSCCTHQGETAGLPPGLPGELGAGQAACLGLRAAAVNTAWETSLQASAKYILLRAGEKPGKNNYFVAFSVTEY